MTPAPSQLTGPANFSGSRSRPLLLAAASPPARGSDARYCRHLASGDSLGQSLVIALVLIGVGGREAGDRMVELLCSRTVSRTSSGLSMRSGGSRRAGRLDPEVVSEMLGRKRADDPLSVLSAREREVLGLMAEGRSNRAIAESLVITERAVERHVTSIFAKLNLTPAPEDHRRVRAVLVFLGT
jgi:DNA-binding CsgD family transcriptional regulator